jgi:hypothetical protein
MLKIPDKHEQILVPILYEEKGSPSFVSRIVLTEKSTSVRSISSAASSSVFGQSHLVRELKISKGRENKISLRPPEHLTLRDTSTLHLPCAGCQVFCVGVKDVDFSSHTIVAYNSSSKSDTLANITGVSVSNTATQKVTNVDLSSVHLSLSVGDNVLLFNNDDKSSAKPGIIEAVVVRVFELSFLLVSLSRPSNKHGSLCTPFISTTSTAFSEFYSLRLTKRKATLYILPVNFILLIEPSHHHLCDIM